MDRRLDNLYRLPNLADNEDLCLQTLRESCASLETRLQELAESLPEYDRQTIEAYLDIRDELEFQSVKTALRIGKRHYKQCKIQSTTRRFSWRK